MKKAKLLIPILGVTTLSSGLIPLVGCSNNQNHVWLVDTDKPKKDADENLKAKYYFGLDSDKYETKDIEVKIDSTTRNLFIVDYFVSGNILVVQVQFVGSVEEATPIEFTLKVSTKNWSQSITGLTINVPVTDPTDVKILKQINKILANSECNTMSEAITILNDNGIDAEKLTCEIENGIYVWDQSVNKFAIINSITGNLIYGTDGYELNQNKWQLWKMVAPRDEVTENDGGFNSYCKYSQYLKLPTETLKLNSSINPLDKVDYSFISGFDCGKNTDVKTVHYIYEKPEQGEEVVAKDIIINTNSENTNVDISAYKGDSVGDTVTHYGTMGELTVVSNNVYQEQGKAISATVYEGTIDIGSSANIEMTYVRSTDVVLDNYKSSQDNIYAESQDIADNLKDSQGQPISVPTENVQDEQTYQETKEEYYEQEHPEAEITYVFDATDGTNTMHFNSLSAIAQYSNDTVTEHTEDEPDRFFTGWTITLNKDYDMALECENWTPICAGTKVEAYQRYEYNKTTVQEGFAGTFDGNGHSIINMNLGSEDNPLTYEVALFGGVNGTIKNLNIVDCSVNIKCSDTTTAQGMRTCAGGLLAMALGTKTENAGKVTIDSVNIVNSKLNCQYKSGLFAPYIQYANEVVINNCTTDEYTELVSSCPEGTTLTSETGAGHGWFGHMAYNVKKMTLTDCVNNASITGINASGGFIGMYGSNAYGLTMERCTNNGKITTTSYPKIYGPQAGGLIGCIQQTSTSVVTQIKIKNCVNNGAVDAPTTPTHTGHAWRIGGFIGYLDDYAIAGSTLEFENCKNTGHIGSDETVALAPNQAAGAGFMGTCAVTEGKMVVVFKSCENAGLIDGVKVGHFAREISTGQTAGTFYCEECTITGSLRDGAERIKIPGEPD